MTPVLNLSEENVFAAMRYMLGMSDTPPETGMFGIEPSRLRGFWARWLATHPRVSITLHKPFPPMGASRSETRPAAIPPMPKQKPLKQHRDEDFIAAGRRLATERNIDIGSAMAIVARERPDLYDKYIEDAQRLAALRAEHRLLESQNESAKRQAATRKQEN